MPEEAITVESDKPELNKAAADLVTDEMKDQAAESVAKVNQTRKMPPKDEDRNRLRTKSGGTGGRRQMTVSDIPYPAEVHGEDFKFYGPMGMAAEIPEGTDVSAFSEDQEFVLNFDKLEYLSFDAPGRNLPKKRLYTIKALHKDGRFVQLPFEPQIQNNAGGDPEDAIGLRRYQRKGMHIFIDWNTLIPVYCAAWGCTAQAQNRGDAVGFCSLRHAQHTLPNRYKGATAINQGLMEAGVTTSRTWEV